ncbi:MAG: hypothetical protein HYY11_03050 [Candidatus Methylomirabilis oxyfera]|nr:hypothetical protein [Candidatus Methylomirabilis oxyfera]
MKSSQLTRDTAVQAAASIAWDMGTRPPAWQREAIAHTLVSALRGAAHASEDGAPCNQEHRVHLVILDIEALCGRRLDTRARSAVQARVADVLRHAYSIGLAIAPRATGDAQ